MIEALMILLLFAWTAVVFAVGVTYGRATCPCRDRPTEHGEEVE